jgi:hypothetical protein
MLFRFMLAGQTVGLLLAAASWWRVSNCVCVSTLESAAFWTGLIIAQRAVIISFAALRSQYPETRNGSIWTE